MVSRRWSQLRHIGRRMAVPRSARRGFIAAVFVQVVLAAVFSTLNNKGEIAALGLAVIVVAGTVTFALNVVAGRSAAYASAQARVRWAALVRNGMSDSQINEERLAEITELPRGLLDLMLRGSVEPYPQETTSISRALGLNEVRLMEVLGQLAPGVAARLERVESTRSWVADLAEARARLQRAEGLRHVAPGGLVAGAALGGSDAVPTAKASRDGVRDVLLRPCVRGHLYPILFADYVSLGWITGPGEPDHEAIRRSAMRSQYFADEMQRTSATWETSMELLDWVPPSRARALVLTVPRLLATQAKASNAAKLKSGYRSIVVIGTYSAGSPDVAALVGKALGWGHFNLSNWTSEAFGDRSSRARFIDRQVDVARELLRDPLGAGGNFVWSYNEIEAVTRSLPVTTESDQPIIIFLASDADLSDYSAEWMPRRNFTSSKENALRLLNEMSSTVHNVILKRTVDSYLVLQVGSPVWHEDNPYRDAVHEFFDCYVDTAYRVLDWLRAMHGAPPEPIAGPLAEFERKNHFIVSSVERARLERLAESSVPNIASRARIIMDLSDGWTISETAQRLKVGHKAVENCRRSFYQERLSIFTEEAAQPDR